MNEDCMIQRYEVVNGTLVVPKDKVTPSMRVYCSKNHIKLVPVAK